MVDQRFFRRCSSHKQPRSPQIEPVIEQVNTQDVFNYDDTNYNDTKTYEEDSDSLSFYSDTDSSTSKLSNAENVIDRIDAIDTIDTMDTDGDEGFFDKSDIRHLIV